MAFLWIGGNDFIFAVNQIAAGDFAVLNTTETNVDVILNTLSGANMDIVVFNLPDFSYVPLIQGQQDPSSFGNFRYASRS